MTIAKAYSIFINDKRVSCSNETIIYYSYNIEKFIDYLEERSKRPANEIELNEVDKSIVNEFILNLRSLNKYSGHPFISSDRRIKNTSINTYLRAVKIFMCWCFNEEFLQNDIFKTIKLPKQDSDSVIPLYQEEAVQIDSMFNNKTETGLRNLCIVHLMLDAGCRRGEVINLKIKDIMFDKNIIYVYGKGGKYRIIPLCPKLKSMLYRYCVIYRSFISSECIPDQNLFVKIGSQEYINKSTINQLFRRIKNTTGIDRLHPHLLRHTFATSYIMGGGNLEFLRLIMGHSDYNITRRYLHLANQYSMMGASIYKLDAMFFKSAY